MSDERQVSASNTDLLLQCQRPWDPTVPRDPREVGEAANWGSAVHELVSTPAQKWRSLLTAEKWGLDLSEAFALNAHASAVLSALDTWLSGDNPWGVKFRVVSREKSIATSISKYGVARNRETTLDLETHTYELASREFGGTYDILAQEVKETGYQTGAPGGPRRIVLDLKTGDYGDFSQPARLGQLRTLALQTDANLVGIIHAPRGLPPVIYAEEISTVELVKHAKAIRQAMRRIGDGSLRPGPHCKYCPVKTSCPANTGELVISASALVRTAANAPLAIGSRNAGEFHMMWAELQKVAERARGEIKALVEAGEVFERPDGKTLVILEKEVTNLSQASITRALGKLEGAKMIEKLRKLGCIETQTRKELWAK